jgi:hypothetical protein
MPSERYEPSHQEVASWVANVADALRRGERLPLWLRLELGLTAERVAAWRLPEEVDITDPGCHASTTSQKA